MATQHKHLHSTIEHPRGRSCEHDSHEVVTLRTNCATRQARLPTNDQNGTTSGPFFLDGRKRIAPGPSPSPEQGCTAPGTLSASRPALPTSTLAPAALSNSDRQVHQLIRRVIDGEVQVLSGSPKRRQDGRHRCVDPRPAQTPCHRQVGLRRHPAEVREPVRQGRR